MCVHLFSYYGKIFSDNSCVCQRNIHISSELFIALGHGRSKKCGNQEKKTSYDE